MVAEGAVEENVEGNDQLLLRRRLPVRATTAHGGGGGGDEVERGANSEEVERKRNYAALPERSVLRQDFQERFIAFFRFVSFLTDN